MGNPEREWRLEELRGLTREDGIALLSRAAQSGLLTDHGDGYYSIHPALPWYFKTLFETHYPASAPSLPPSASEGPGEVRATRAFVEAMGELGNYYHRQYNEGNREVIPTIAAEEANLLHARRLARSHGWWDALTSAMQGLSNLYEQTGRVSEWKRLVEEIVPDFVHPETDLPLPGREDQWSLVTEYRVRLAQGERRWEDAQRLHSVCVDWNRQQAAAALQGPPEPLDDAQRNQIRTLAMSLGTLGQIQRERESAECVSAFEEAADLLRRIGDKAAEAITALDLGHAYKNLPAIRDLSAAERWYRRSLSLQAENDRLGRSKCLSQLGLVAYEHFGEAREDGRPEAAQLGYFNEAVGFYHQALALTPPNAVDSLAVKHNQLGAIFGDAGDLDRAVSHYREAIRYDEAAGNLYNAALVRSNVAIHLARAGRFTDASAYANAALRNYQTFGARAAAETQRTEGLIAQIEEAARQS